MTTLAAPAAPRPRTGPGPAGAAVAGLPPLPLFDHHIHADGRNADDYELMAISGVTTVLVPCSATGERRPVAASFAARFDRLLEAEAARAARYGVDLYVGLAVHAADMAGLDGARGGIRELAARLDHPRVLAVGELALRSFGPDEEEILERQLAVAAEHGKPVMIETPPPPEAFARMVRVLDRLLDRGPLPRDRVALMDLDHAKLRLARELGVGAYGLPVSPPHDGLFRLREKLDARAVAEILAEHGPDRLMLNTGFHYGSADPLGLAKTVLRLRLAGVPDPTLRAVAYDNAAEFFGLPGR